ncbi:hypothetical protein CVT26_003337 [Gymnopilus dilepis]|uniref:Cytochrome P450 n=1 Tax=Gymnopilus dilepis TaxID=231916 RepID=A0A409W2Z0_9AGAR|nr:hypothetical protein CVT26_003337 [Gymnopilus dilepis]
MPIYLSVASVLLIAWVLKRLIDAYAKNDQGRSYAPGPRPLPLVGNMFDLPTSRTPEVYVEWGKRYQSDILFATTPLYGVLILNKQEDADELFERRSRIYSDRPQIPILELIGWEWNISLFRYGTAWRFHRQICQQNFRAEAVRAYHPLLLDKVHDMCRRLLGNPENFDEHNRRLSISVPMVTMYGYDVKSFEDPCIIAVEENTLTGASLLMPGATLANFIPPLAKLRIPTWLPGASTWKTAKRLRELSQVARNIPYDFVKKSMAEGTAIDSFVSTFLKKKEEYGASEIEEDAIKNIAMTIYGAASDTTIAATNSFIYFMAIHPEIQRKAQTEIDQVVGNSRLPDFDDRPALPYIEAIYRELLRIEPPAPMGLPHRVTEDDCYKRYFIPKGTVVFGNVWAMAHDEDVYPEPFVFKPERFLDDRGSLNDDARVLAYGFGRRRVFILSNGVYCVSSSTLPISQNMCWKARRERYVKMWMIVASILACFNIVKSKDGLGNEIDISDEYEDFGPMRHKTKFRCTFVPRSNMIEQILQDAET